MNDYRKLFSLEGKTGIITGSCGIIGTEVARGLAAHGSAVALFDLNEVALNEQADDLRSRYGGMVIPVVCDVADPVAVQKGVAMAAERTGNIDFLFNNAATRPPDLAEFFRSPETFKLETWDYVMRVNLDGMWLMAQAVGAQMLRQPKGGSIVQTSSIYGMLGPDNRIYEGSNYMGGPINTPVVYAASKGGVIALTRYLATMWGANNIRVNTLIPGGVKSGQNEEFCRRYSARVPMGRQADAWEMVGAVIYLVSEASSYVTGQEIAVDGGLSAW